MADLPTCLPTSAFGLATAFCRFARLPADEVDEELVEVDTVETIERPWQTLAACYKCSQTRQGWPTCSIHPLTEQLLRKVRGRLSPKAVLASPVKPPGPVRDLSKLAGQHELQTTACPSRVRRLPLSYHSNVPREGSRPCFGGLEAFRLRHRGGKTQAMLCLHSVPPKSPE